MLGYEENCKHTVNAAKETIKENLEDDIGWFKHRKHTLQL